MHRHTLMSMVAQRNTFHSVDDHFPTEEQVEESVLLLGVKNVKGIPGAFIRSLELTGKYRLHTLDKSAWGGRAIDLNLLNPITGRYMTGSSSGTAINVFLGMNDIGIGLDGGGSVIAPAMSLNLVGFISPLIDAEMMSMQNRQSTDGIMFTPSIGYMTVTLSPMIEIIRSTIGVESNTLNPVVFTATSDRSDYAFNTHRIEFPDVLGQRLPLIAFLEKTLPKCDVLISQEGPIDLEGFGDTVYGHFDHRTHAEQRKAQKGLLRVVNMAHATAITIPQTSLSVGYLLICESIPHKIGALLDLAAKLEVKQDELISRYFRSPQLVNDEKFSKE